MSKEKDRIWAESLMETIKADQRPYVRKKDGRAVTDLKDLLVSSAEIYADKVAFLQKWNLKDPFKAVTYREVLEDVNGLGTALLDAGLKGKRISVIGENSYQWCTVYLAVTGGVGCIVPLDKELNQSELKRQVIRAEVEAVFFDQKHQKIFEDILAEGDTPLKMIVNMDTYEKTGNVESWRGIMNHGKALLSKGDKSYIDAEVDGEDMAAMLFTSGTTGTPKGVMLSHRNLCSELMMTPTIFVPDDDERFMSFLPLHHTYECTVGFLMAVYTGSSVAFCQGLKYLLKNFQEVQPTIMLGVPVLFEKIYSILWKNVRKMGKEKALKRLLKVNRVTKKIGVDLGNALLKDVHHLFGGRMKTLVCGGAKVDPDVLEGFRDFGFNAFQGYGLTESSPIAVFNPDCAPISASIGVPLPGVEIKAIEANDEGIGEICIKGPNIMMGYYNNPEETAKAIDEEGWLHSGDLGYIKDGYVYLTGRAKNVIITKNGKNVYPEVIERYLGSIPFVEESFVFEDQQEIKDDTCIAAAIKVDEEEVEHILGAGFTDEQVKELLREEVAKINREAPAYRRITKIILRKTDFIHNTTQKLVRHAEENKSENA